MHTFTKTKQITEMIETLMQILKKEKKNSVEPTNTN